MLLPLERMMWVDEVIPQPLISGASSEIRPTHRKDYETEWKITSTIRKGYEREFGLQSTILKDYNAAFGMNSTIQHDITFAYDISSTIQHETTQEFTISIGGIDQVMQRIKQVGDVKNVRGVQHAQAIRRRK